MNKTQKVKLNAVWESFLEWSDQCNWFDKDVEAFLTAFEKPLLTRERLIEFFRESSGSAYFKEFDLEKSLENYVKKNKHKWITDAKKKDKGD